MHIRTLAPFAVGLLVACSAVLADSSAPPRLAGVAEAVKAQIEAKEVAGAVTLVASRDDLLHLDADGLADVAAGTPMRADSIFWIASMTKPVTAAAILMLQDEGKLSVDDPVGKYIPELAHLKTADGKEHVVTIRHALTHTSGMAEATGDESAKARTLADLIPAYAAKPLGFAPGTRWSYCQSSINTAGRIVEIVSGKDLEQFFQERLFEPLGMTDTTFYLREAQLPRLAKSYRKEGDKLEESPNWILQGKAPTSTDRYPAANGGLFSTAPDYARFCQMLVGDGSFDGKRYLKPESVKYMSSVLTDDLQTGFTDGNGWGLGVCVVRKPQGVSAALSPGSFGHGGAFGTQAWMDPVRGRVYILMVQRANFPNADNSDLRRAFQGAALAELSGE
jgi:CubicO group peptidase (beta-lactamase class C family)